MKEIKIENLLDLNESIAKEIFDNCEYPWEIIPKISRFIIDLGETLDTKKYEKIDDNIWVSKTAKIADTSCICGPCIIDDEAEIRHSAYIRGNVIIGKKAVVRKFNRN